MDINKDISNLINTEETTSFARLLPNLPDVLPEEPYEYEPPLPSKRYAMPVFSPKVLAKRIYLEMLRAIKDYSELELIAPEEDKKVVSSLKSQMEILSLSMLNIYQQIFKIPKVPYFMSARTSLNRDYALALKQMYDRVYYIHSLVLKLFAISGNASYSTKLLIILTNLKSQLKTLNNLMLKPQLQSIN